MKKLKNYYLPLIKLQKIETEDILSAQILKLMKFLISLQILESMKNFKGARK